MAPPPTLRGVGSGVSLGGASQTHGRSKQELLAHAEAQRAARGAARQQQKAATDIQKAWRGHAARSRIAAQRLQRWSATYGALATEAATAGPDAAAPPCETVRAAVGLLTTALLPPMASPLRRRLEQGAPLAAVVQQPGQRRALAGLISLVTQSLRSGGAGAHYLAAPGATPQLAAQARLLCLLCCAAIAAGERPDPVLDAAAARVLELLLARPRDTDTPRAAVADALARQPLPLLCAARRVASRAVASGGSPQDRGAAAAPPSSGISDTAVLSRLVGLVLLPLEGAAADGLASHAQSTVVHLLSAPGLVAVLPEPACARMMAPGVLAALLCAATDLGRKDTLRGGAAAAVLGNVVHLLLGRPGRPPPSEADLLAVPRSPQLADAGTATALCHAVLQLLPGCGLSGGAAPQAVASQLALLAAQAPLLQVMATLGEEGVPLFAATCLHLLQDLPSPAGSAGQAQPTDRGGPALNTLAFAPRVLPTLWRWLAVSLGLPLDAPAGARLGLDVASVAGGCQGLDLEHALVLGVFCRALTQLLLVLADDDIHTKGEPFGAGAARAIAASLNALVYHTHFPASSVAADPAARRRVLGGRGQQPAAPAAAAALPRGTLRAASDLLERYAPVALRGLYIRDQRRAFCQPALWTAPYAGDVERRGPARDGTALQAAPVHQGLRAVAAVVQGLLFGGRGAEVAGRDGPGGGGAGSEAAAPALVSPTGAPSAMTALLRVAPQCVPFDVRLDLFRQVLAEDRARGRWALTPADGGPRPLKLTVRRPALLEDAFHALAGKGDALKGKLYVTFVNASGLEEAGLDHGGLTKELLEAAVGAALQPGYGLFEVASGSGLAFPSPMAPSIPHGLALLQFTGALVGKALYDGILLPDLALAPPLVVALQGARPSIDDLAGVDAGLASGLAAVRGYEGESADLGLTFSVDVDVFGTTRSYDLLPGGAATAVTNANRALYCHLLADFHLNRRLGRPAAAFCAGMAGVLPLAALRLFSPAEFNQLLSGGSEGGIDVEDWKANTVYSNGYTASSRVVRLFWDVVEDLAPAQRGALLRFVTSSSRAPLGGFRHLTPPFTLHRVDCGPRNPLAGIIGRDLELLPSASTCFCMLKLPNYSTKRGLRDKLLYSITAGAGFELS